MLCRYAWAGIVVHLLKVKCLPIFHVNATDVKSLDFPIFKTLVKSFKTASEDNIIIVGCRIFNAEREMKA